MILLSNKKEPSFLQSSHAGISPSDYDANVNLISAQLPCSGVCLWLWVYLYTWSQRQSKWYPQHYLLFWQTLVLWIPIRVLPMSQKKCTRPISVWWLVAFTLSDFGKTFCRTMHFLYVTLPASLPKANTSASSQQPDTLVVP